MIKLASRGGAKTRFILVRHPCTEGEKGSYYGWSDVPLSKPGMEQAALVVERLRGENIAAVCCSDLQRAQILGEMIASGKNLPLQVDKRIREMNFGEWEGRPFSQLIELEEFRVWLDDLFHAPVPKGENMSEMLRRTAEFLASLIKDYPEKSVLIVSHYGAIIAMIRQLLKLEEEDWWSLHVDLASITIVDWWEHRGQLVLLNDRCHLSEKPCLP